MNTDKAINLALIITELITNTAKHAYVDARGAVRVRIERSGDALQITVRDRGRGITPGFEVAKGSGFGTRLVKTLVDQMKGRLAVNRHTPGTEFVLEVPLDPKGPLSDIAAVAPAL